MHSATIDFVPSPIKLVACEGFLQYEYTLHIVGARYLCDELVNQSMD